MGQFCIWRSVETVVSRAGRAAYGAHVRFLTGVEALSPRSRCQGGGLRTELCPWLADGRLLSVPARGGGRQRTLSQGHGPEGRGHGPMTPFNLSHLLTAPPPDSPTSRHGAGDIGGQCSHVGILRGHDSARGSRTESPSRLCLPRPGSYLSAGASVSVDGRARPHFY